MLMFNDWLLTYHLRFLNSSEKEALWDLLSALQETTAAGRAAPHAAFRGLILKSILGWMQSAAKEMLTLPVFGMKNPFPVAPCRLSRWRRYVRQRRAVATWRWTCTCVPEQIRTFCFSPRVKETSGVGTDARRLILKTSYTHTNEASTRVKAELLSCH